MTRFATSAINPGEGRGAARSSNRGPIPRPDPPLPLDHLCRLTGRFGLFEHARLDRPRVSHGYTTDDNARALVVLASMRGDQNPDLSPYLDFVVAGRVPGGWRNRMSSRGRWTDHGGEDDAHGRALWGLAHAVSSASGAERALEAFLAGLDFSSPHPRANAYAALGAATAFASCADDRPIEVFLRTVAAHLPRGGKGAWAWPEPRLSYANARLPHAMIAAGRALDDRSMIEDGLSLLDWLSVVEYGDQGFSFTPVAGRGSGERGPAFDQQPIEAWAMADACLLASMVDGASEWDRRLQAAGEWFLGRNDAGVALFDPETGAGFDGLQRDGVNQNRGAESTLAALGALTAMAARPPSSD
jgi:hypothetical protein